jgi:hypothetical protein
MLWTHSNTAIPVKESRQARNTVPSRRGNAKDFGSPPEEE